MQKLLKNMWGLFRELGRIKKYTPEIKSTLKYFDQNENPKKTLEKIINTTKNNPVLDDLLKISKTYKMISRGERRAEEKNWRYACREAIKEMGVNYKIKGKENIPTQGGVLYVCNHPWGLLDGAILFSGLGSLLEKKQRELKVIGTSQLRLIKGIEKIVYFVDSIKKTNFGPIKESLRYLHKGGDLVIYPSGKMSKARLKEYPWENGLKTFIAHSSYVVPMWFSGPDHAIAYNFLAKFKITEDLKRIFSLREVWNKTGQTVVLNIGKSIKSEELIEKNNAKKKIEYLRKKAEALKVYL